MTPSSALTGLRLVGPLTDRRIRPTGQPPILADLSPHSVARHKLVRKYVLWFRDRCEPGTFAALINASPPPRLLAEWA